MNLVPILNVAMGVAFVALILYLQISRGMYRTAKKTGTENLKVPKDIAAGEVIIDHVSLDDLQGLWRMISVGRNGNFAPKEVIERSNFTIAIVGNTLTNTGALTMSTIEVKNDVVPNHLDQMDEDGDKHLCLVRLRNNHLEMCQAEVGKPRPKDFNPKRRDGASLVLFERISPAGERESRTGQKLSDIKYSVTQFLSDRRTDKSLLFVLLYWDHHNDQHGSLDPI